MNDEELFKQFLKEYLDNVKKVLPKSYRAQQLNSDNVESSLVNEYETIFLKKPFMKAINEIRKNK